MSSNSPLKDTVVITDTSCLIILEKIGLLAILHKLFTQVITTPEIAREYGITLPDWIIIASARNSSFKDELLAIVDEGEASAIALAHEIKNDYLITDDLEARKLAIKLKLPVIGTLGVLLRAKQESHINSVKPYIELIKQTDFRVSDDLYETVLRKAEEE